MTVELDLAQDLEKCVDGLEDVRLRRRESGEIIASARALRRHAVTQEAEPSGGAARRADAVWHLQLPGGASPQLGDVVIDGRDERWTILQAQEQPVLGRWKCATRNLSVAYGCDDRVDVERAEWGDLGEGPVIVGWNFLYTALPVRIQPGETVVSGPPDAPTSTARFTIILGEAFPLGPDDRFVAADGKVYRLESIEQAERIDVLPIARVVKVSG